MSDEILKKMQEHMDAAVLGTFMGTCTKPVPQKPLSIEELLKTCDMLLREFRRHQVTFVVDLAHQGPYLQHETPCDGSVIEMSWHQANELHQHWPMKLSKVLSETSAEFVPISGLFQEFVMKILPMPPYELPTETFEEWWGGEKPENA